VFTVTKGNKSELFVYQTVALVGESGSGKSTAIALLQRFYDPDVGHILLDGVDIQKFQLRWLRQQMGLVSQEPALFNETIRANIAYGKDGQATESEITAAAELANAHRFISSSLQVRLSPLNLPKLGIGFAIQLCTTKNCC
jgi:ATP-binding cassette subfamily B (MDR/TAP) protein 1